MSIDTTNFNPLTGFYRGQVVKHSPIEKGGGNGKCKIWIPGVYDPSFNVEPYDKLPDAEQAVPLFCMSGPENTTGMYFYPDVGSFVWCFFQSGDQNFPVYFAGSMFTINRFCQLETDESKNTKITDKTIVVDDLKIHIARNRIDGTTEFKISCADDQNVITMNSKENQIEIKSTGKIIIDGQEEVQLKSDRISLLNNTGSSIQLDPQEKIHVMGKQIGIAARNHIELKPKCLSLKAFLHRLVF